MCGENEPRSVRDGLLRSWALACESLADCEGAWERRRSRTVVVFRAETPKRMGTARCCAHPFARVAGVVVYAAVAASAGWPSKASMAPRPFPPASGMKWA